MAQLALLIVCLTASVAAAPYAGATKLERRQSLESCPGYTASNVLSSPNSLTAELSLSGDACNVYGTDIDSLLLTVTYETDKRLHVLIEDASHEIYRVPESVLPRPVSQNSTVDESDLEFSYGESPFTFTVKRKSTGEALFDSSAAPLVFEDQYLRLRTALPEDPNLYGLGEHSDSFRLNTTNYTRTMWSRDAFGIPEGSNLYGNHPIYFDHRESGSHGVFLLSSAGMDIKINNTQAEGQYLEYNTLGGVIDLYFLAGDTPLDVSKQYAELVGLPAMNSYWSLGFHNCRYGYRDFYAVAETIANYSSAGIPLETQWTDIDYMYERWIFTVDPTRFEIARVRDIVDYLHEHDQHYIVMVDPAVAYNDFGNYSTLSRGIDQDVFMKYDNGTIFTGVVWPGPTVFPDWFHPNTQAFWSNEFAQFFDPGDGIDIDGLWIDMNEAANFCPFPCLDPVGYSENNRFPPQRPFLRSQPREIPGFPAEFQPGAQDYPPDSLPYNDPNLAPPASPNSGPNNKRQASEIPGQSFSAELTTPVGVEGRNLLAPPYRINNANTFQDIGGNSNQTIRTDLHHYHGLADLDVHNLYGTMMSEASRGAMIDRRPKLRPLVITRSTFAGAGRKTGKWLGDNLSIWDHYRNQIQGMLDFSAIYQVPMVGSDVCGFGQNTTETLCARWAMLGAFNPFYRNHNQDSALPQEFYIWPSVTAAAKKAIDIRYRLLDYFYTALYEQTLDGTPSLNPLFFKYPTDSETFGNALQFFYGPSILVSPVTEENSTSVSIYIPKDTLYDFYTYEKVDGQGEWVNLTDVAFDHIPLHIKGGSIIPFRSESAMTTTEVRTKPFDVVIAPGSDGNASGSLYLDDGVSIEQEHGWTYLKFSYNSNELHITGGFGYQEEGNKIAKFTVLGVESAPAVVTVSKKGEYNLQSSGGSGCYTFDAGRNVLTITAEIPLDANTTISWH
ncbi:putative alpha-glucosidase [Pseudovirgaria hyperparasitica]|uniref:Probable alpha/beta-glucosidase agdC n=1 Tax=Pseudovirgaria hyperparasitica TaxID=470096 RepID=A0A6A6VU35_9PEZI|nr:putative alpha-glucosidase [Pseudovirgaria hyperparasitica]KAF2752757.1 putative alpha-glucosidase [Pseudovirgaria hyperparasitica]